MSDTVDKSSYALQSIDETILKDNEVVLDAKEMGLNCKDPDDELWLDAESRPKDEDFALDAAQSSHAWGEGKVATTALTTYEAFAILRKYFPPGRVETVKVAHVAFVCAQSEKELPPQILDEVAMYSNTVFSPSVDDLYEACKGKELAFVVGGSDDQKPPIRRPHGLGSRATKLGD